MLHVPKVARMKQYHYGNHLTIRHDGFLFGRVAKHVGFKGGFKTITKLICQIENISNLIRCDIHVYLVV